MFETANIVPNPHVGASHEIRKISGNCRRRDDGNAFGCRGACPRDGCGAALITFRWRDQILTEKTSWKVLWDTRNPSDPACPNVTLAGSVAEAMERAAHFLKLGFFVLCMKAASGAVLMTESDIADRFRHVRRAAMETGIR